MIPRHEDDPRIGRAAEPAFERRRSRFAEALWFVSMACCLLPAGAVIVVTVLSHGRATALAAQTTPPSKRGAKSPPAKSVEAEPKSSAESTDEPPVDDKSENPTSDDQSALMTLEEAERTLPSATALLEGPPIDWIVLHSGRVIRVEPVDPRPDADNSANTIDKIQASIKKNALALPPRPKGNEDRTAYEAAYVKHTAMYFLLVTLAEEDEKGTDFRINIKHIRQIIYFEDLMLRRIDRLLDQKKGSEAFELLTALKDRAPHWSGIDERVDRLLFVEAAIRVRQQAPEEALVFLEDLQHRNPRYDGLRTQLGTVLTQLVSSAADRQDYREARHFLERLRKLLPDYRTVAEWTNALQSLATQRLDQAAEAARQGRHDAAAEFAETASGIWPNLPQMQDQYRRFANRFQRLHVGVLEFPKEASDSLVPSEANLRRKQLGPPSFFEPARIDGKVVRYQTRFFEEWEPTELGRSILFRVKRRAAPWESHKPVTAGRIVSALADRMNPQNPAHDERFSASISSVNFRSPFEFEVDFARIPLRAEMLFAFPVDAEHSAPIGDDSSADRTQDQPLFVEHARSDDRIAYRRAITEQAEGAKWHLAELVEHKYPTHEKAIQGLLRGEVSLLPHVPLWDVPRLTALKTFFVHSYALPVTHLLQFHPKHPALANRTLRRAMVFALDRQQILDAVMLHRANEEATPGATPPKGAQQLGRLTSAPLPSSGIGYDSLIVPHKYDPTLAVTMLIAASKELGAEIPPMRLHCPDDSAVIEAAQQLIKQWNAIGLKVSLAGSTNGLSLDLGADPPEWDIIYRTVSLDAPVVQLWPFLTLDPRGRVESLAHLPNWLRQELVALEAAGDWTSAERILHEMHRQLWAEVTLIPLWELDDFLVVRSTVRDVPSRPMTTYQGIERWIVQPWYPKEAP